MRSLGLVLVILCAPATVLADKLEWKDAMVVNIRVLNEWCRHCPDAQQTYYSFKTGDGMVYVARIHGLLDVTLNGHIQFRVEGEGHIGGYVHIIDEKGKDKKLRITGKEREPKPQEDAKGRSKP